MLLGCTAAAMLPKQARRTYRKHMIKPFLQVAATDCTLNGESSHLFNILGAMYEFILRNYDVFELFEVLVCGIYG